VGSHERIDRVGLRELMGIRIDAELDELGQVFPPLNELISLLSHRTLKIAGL
jgi:hypothetical protein